MSINRDHQMFTFLDSLYFFEYSEASNQSRSSKPSDHPTVTAMFDLFRDTLYDSYQSLPSLTRDITEFKPAEDQDKSGDPLYDYVVNVTKRDFASYLDPQENMHSYFAYKIVDGEKKLAGFVNFQSKIINHSPKIYIALLGVVNRGHGLGKGLVDCVLSHYEPNTEFYLIARRLNIPACELFGRKLKFNASTGDGTKEFGFDERYCGFERTTTAAEIDEINSSKMRMIQSV
jgi:hypothetical protein